MQKQFVDFYNNKYQGRRLTWAYSNDRCLVTARFPKGKKELEVSFHQALVLLCFNLLTDNNNGDTDSNISSSGSSSSGKERLLSFGAVKSLVPLEDSELKRTLISLCNGIIGTILYLYICVCVADLDMLSV